MEDSFESVQITDDEVTELIKTSYKINRFVRISDFKEKVDATMISMLIEDSYITRELDNIYDLISPFLKKVHKNELELEEKPKFNKKSIRLNKYKSVSQVKYVLEKMNTDLMAIKQYIIDHENLEFSEEIGTMCNYIVRLMDFIYQNKEKENLKF